MEVMPLNSLRPLKRATMPSICERMGGAKLCSIPRSAQTRSNLCALRSWAAAEAKQPVGDLIAVIAEHPCDLHRGGAVETAQEVSDFGRRLCRVEADNAEAPPVQG